MERRLKIHKIFTETYKCLGGKAMKKYKVGIIGATGMVGTKIYDLFW